MGFCTMKAEKMSSEVALASHVSRPVDPMEQVRDLLFGEAKRGHDQRFEEMQATIDALTLRLDDKIDVLANRLDARLDALQAEVNALRVSGRHEQDTTINAVGEALADVGRKIAALKAYGG